MEKNPFWHGSVKITLEQLNKAKNEIKNAKKK